jgi:ribokinase
MRATVIGNAALDETLSVAALPRPGASIHARELSRDLGGKGVNQAVVLSRAGIEVTLIAPIGPDPRGAEIRDRLAAEGLSGALVTVEAPSDLSMILATKDGENAVVTTHAAAEALTPEAAVSALTGDLLVVQGNLSEATTRAVLAAARARGLATAANPSPLRPWFPGLWPLIDTVVLNEGEAEALGSPQALLAAGVRQVVLTLGARGATLITATGEEHVPAAAATVIDPTGAGDCFMATALASALRRGTTLDVRALRHGTQAAALTVARPGTLLAFPTREEMAAILARP